MGLLSFEGIALCTANVAMWATMQACLFHYQGTIIGWKGVLPPSPHNTPEKPGSSTIMRGPAESGIHRIYPAIRRASFSKETEDDSF